MRNHFAPLTPQTKPSPSFLPAHSSRLFCEETPLSPTLRGAVQAEAHFRSSRGFDEAFWARLEERRARNATFKGRCQQLLETELSGVAVWRVLGCGALGAAFPALVLIFCVGGLSSSPASIPSPPVMGIVTPWNQRRFWEELAWQNPTKPVLVTLLDPNWKGGERCGYRFAV